MRVTTYDMDGLSRRSGVGARTIRSWMEARLLPRPRGRGREAEYDERHLRRGRVVKALRILETPRSVARERPERQRPGDDTHARQARPPARWRA